MSKASKWAAAWSAVQTLKPAEFLSGPRDGSPRPAGSIWASVDEDGGVRFGYSGNPGVQAWHEFVQWFLDTFGDPVSATAATVADFHDPRAGGAG